jgi:hypothetical protein
MRGFVYNNPKLAVEADGCWSFDSKGPHPYWCVIKKNDVGVLLAPVLSGVLDDLPESALDMLPYQITDVANAVTLLIGRCIARNERDLTTDPVFYINPNEMKKAYAKFQQLLKGC